MPDPSGGPLAGVLVCDLTRVLAGPFATLQLADLGARVIKIERPGTGDDSRSYGPFVNGASLYFARVNRGKESVVADLKNEDDRALVRRIAARADVFVENFRPGVAERMGLGYAALCETNPRLVYASISGFGQTGPWRERPAYDAVVQSLSGLVAVTGRPGAPMVKPGVPIADLSAGLYAFAGICAALLGAARTGRGTFLDVSMHDASLSLLEGAALRFLATGQDPPLIGDGHHAIAPFDTFATRDGRMTICAANDALFTGLAAALGDPGLAEQPRYATNAQRHLHSDQLRQDLEALLGAADTEDWVGRLTAAGIPCGTVAGVGEALSSPQARARRMVVEAGGLPLPGQALKLSGLADEHERPGAPELGAHDAAVRREFAGAPDGTVGTGTVGTSTVTAGPVATPEHPGAGPVIGTP